MRENYLKNQIKKGFTLAEVLITLAIIGVVAAITIPALISKFEDMQLKNAFKEDYATISQAYQMLVTENGGSLEGAYNRASFGAAMAEKLKVVKYCPEGQASECIPNLSSYKFLNGGPSGSADGGCGTFIVGHPELVDAWVSMVLNNGSVFTISNWYQNCNQSNAYASNYCAASYHVAIDVNGVKGPNVSGKDLFNLIPYKDTLKPSGLPANMSPYTLGYARCSAEQSCRLDRDGSGCAAKVLSE